MREEFEKLVATGKISQRQIDPLVVLATNGYCMHRSWGFGRIRQVDMVFGRFQIDFPNKAAHSMDLAFAAESLKPISRDHILARKSEDINAVRQMAALHHLDLVKLVLQSFGGRATADQIQRVLVPDVIADDWKKWWDAARRELKKDGHFQVPLKKTDPVVYQVTEVSLDERLIADIRSARGLKARLVGVGELLRNLPDLQDKEGIVQEAIDALNLEIISHQRTLPALALEGVFMRDDLRAAVGLAKPEGEVDAGTIWSQTNDVGSVLEAVAAAKHKRSLLSLMAARPEHWQSEVLQILNSASTKLCGECVGLLNEHGQPSLVKEYLARLISQHAASSELLLWLAKERSDSYADVLGPEVFRAMLSAIERDQFNEKKSNKLPDFILADQDLLVELIELADIDVIKDLTRALQLSPSFDDMDKRSLLARIVKHFPAVQVLITGEHKQQDNSLIVSWESLDRRKREYDELVQKKIPANSRDIAIARSYGDLSENHEYKAAKETHRVLLRRKSELENELTRARGTDFANPSTDVAGIGTEVSVVGIDHQHSESFHLLGAWDFDAEKHIISYLSPVGQVLLNRKAGDEIELDLQGHTSRYRIERIAVSSMIPKAPTGTATADGPDAATP